MNNGRTSACKECRKAVVYANRALDPEKARAACRRYYAEHREELKAYQKRYRDDHPNLWTERYARDRLDKLRKDAERRRLHPEKHRERQKTRRARHAGVPYESVDFAAVLSALGATCWLCGEEIDLTLDRQTDRWALTYDHIVPLFMGGAHIADNLRPAHRSCNSGRNNRMRAEQKRPA